MYRLATKRTEKNESKKRQRKFFRDRQSGVHWSCYVLLFTDFVIEVWSVTLEWIEFGCIHKLYQLNRIVPTIAVRQLVSETALIVCQYTVRYVISSSIGYHSNS